MFTVRVDATDGYWFSLLTITISLYESIKVYKTLVPLTVVVLEEIDLFCVFVFDKYLRKFGMSLFKKFMNDCSGYIKQKQ